MERVMGPVDQAQQHNEKELESFSVSGYSFK
jgi:hypothetical protein